MSTHSTCKISQTHLKDVFWVIRNTVPRILDFGFHHFWQEEFAVTSFAEIQEQESRQKVVQPPPPPPAANLHPQWSTSSGQDGKPNLAARLSQSLSSGEKKPTRVQNPRPTSKPSPQPSQVNSLSCQSIRGSFRFVVEYKSFFLARPRLCSNLAWWFKYRSSSFGWQNLVWCFLKWHKRVVLKDDICYRPVEFVCPWLVYIVLLPVLFRIIVLGTYGYLCLERQSSNLVNNRALYNIGLML